ncbi:hypothetical protein LIER_35580 [Lithospermum erythrorhizon]|uniref:Reverse transcriptase RNase H-like domain-containing protein n=1 Tax=Lithospermum erythrorhizon TaxID=34254 RepID=A0AAV3NWV8_LITER
MQDGKPIAFISKAWGQNQLGLSVYEKELMAVILAITKWKHYLMNSKFVIKTDHQSLKHLLEQKVTTYLQQKEVARLFIQYKRGKENMVADALSRIHHEESHLSSITTIQPSWMTEVAETFKLDTKIQHIVAAIVLYPDSHPGYVYKNGLVRYKGKILVGSGGKIYPGLLQPLRVPSRPWLDISMDFIELTVKIRLQGCYLCSS